jgi:hypothetical protein
MASAHRTIPIPLTQPPLFPNLGESPVITEARRHLLSTMKSAVETLSAQMKWLEATGDLSSTEIEERFEALAWAIDSFREEQELEADEAEPTHLCTRVVPIADGKRGSGRFHGGLRGTGVSWDPQ